MMDVSQVPVSSAAFFLTLPESGLALTRRYRRERLGPFRSSFLNHLPRLTILQKAHVRTGHHMPPPHDVLISVPAI